MTKLRKQPRKTKRQRKGAILIVALIIITTLFFVVLTLGTSMRVEIQAAGNASASAQAAEVEKGAEQYVIGLLNSGYGITTPLTEDLFQQIPVGDGYFWIVRPDYNDESLPLWGLVEENAKININNTNGGTRNMLLNLLDDEDTSTAVQSWRSTSASSSDEYYLTQNPAYQAKHAPFETVEELSMVEGITHDVLYGNGTAPPLGQRSNILAGGMNGGGITDWLTQHGIYELLTVKSVEPTMAPDGSQLYRVDRSNSLRQLLNTLGDSSRANRIMQRFNPNNLPTSLMDLARRGQMSADEIDAIADFARYPATNGQAIRINVNAAPPAVLYSLVGVNGIQSTDIDNLLASRDPVNRPWSLGWVIDACGLGGAARLGPYITNRSYVYSADIVAFSRNGRAFKRCRIIVDASQAAAGTMPQIVYRRDITDKGCPIPQIQASLRSGTSVPGGSAFSARGGI